MVFTGSIQVSASASQVTLVLTLSTSGQVNGLNGPQTSDISWWPKHSAWAQSGLNIGTWNADCERWYKDRLTRIEEGTAKLLSPVQWKSAIRFTHQSLKVAQIGEKLAAQFLDSVI